MKIEMYKSTPHGIRYWSAEAYYDNASIEIRHGKLDGSWQEVTEYVEENESGRSLNEQIDLQLKSRATSKRDIGYRETIVEAKACEGSNTMGFMRPMLAKRIDKVSSVDYENMYLQMKYDGHRCLVTKTTSGLIAYSRNGRRIKTIDHILNGMDIPMGCTIDGELYCHGTPLQTITSWVKKLQPKTSQIEYVVYDMVSDDGYGTRFNTVRSMRLGFNARLAPTDKNVYEDQIPMMLQNAIALGYEGLILRDLNSPYEPGKRSSGLIKVKHFMDEEFKVFDIKPSTDGWAVLYCYTNDGVEFKVSAPGTITQKLVIMKNKNNFIGRTVTVSFANWTKAGKPFHPVATQWREDL